MSARRVRKIPYGVADYAKIRRDNLYYVDKTRFIPLVEAAPYYLFFIRPRRFGKTLWLMVLESYYDINKRDEFDHLFGETWIGAHPTEERNSYLLMNLNFAIVNPDPRYVEESFEANGNAVLDDFLKRYSLFFDDLDQHAILAESRITDRLRRLFFLATRKDLKIYLIIDEYDNFANTILTTAGKQAYHDLTHGAGFFRYFFNLLKGATTGAMGGLTRLFMTGVSPVTMDDVTSGFNIGKNISLEPQFNELVGFTEPEVVELLTYYREQGVLPLTVAECLAVVRPWYNAYCFSKHATTTLYNSDMVLYFVEALLSRQFMPDTMIDQNVRIDYGKLRHLVLVDRQLNGNFSELKAIMETGETISEIITGFPVERVLNRENFISLLFFLGLVTFGGNREGRPVLTIPNLTIKKLMYEYLRDAFEDVNIFRLNFWSFADLLSAMAYRGAWQPVFDFLADAVRQQTSIRDYLQGEKIMQGFLLAYLNISNYFLTWTEHELNKGFADLYLEPFLACYPDMRFGYLIELKYITRSDFSPNTLRTIVQDADQQLRHYRQDARLHALPSNVTVKPLIVVYNGWELVYREELS